MIEASIGDDGVSIKLTDNGGGGANFRVEAIGNRTTAADLGLLDLDDADGDGVIDGGRVVAGLNSKLLSKLNGGQGLGATTSQARVLTVGTPLEDMFDGAGVTTSENGLREMVIFNRLGASFTIDLDPSNTAGDLINLVDAATGGTVTLSISGNSFVLTDNTGGGGNLRAYDNPGSGSTIVDDLGLTVNAAVNSVTGVDTNPVPTATTETGAGQVAIQDRAGVSFTADLTSAISITDVINGINEASEAAGAGIAASLNRSGNGVLITDSSGGAGDITISDTTGATATNLNLVGTFSDDEADSGNLQYQYINYGTSLAKLGVVEGTFTIRDSTGASSTVTVGSGTQSIGDVINNINSRGLAINARINDNGDGIILEDTNAGTPSVAITVEESGSSTAASLGLLGAASAAGEDLDGSYEKTVDFTSDEMTGTTLLTALKGGDGIEYNDDSADFEVTTRDGTQFQVDITDGITTVDELINAIETASGGAVSVQINDAGNRLQLTDNTAGGGQFSFDAINDSRALSDLGFKDDGESGDSDSTENGQTNSGVLVQNTTLRDLADLINDSSVGVSAAIINDGSSGTPYRLILSADKTGTAGSFVFDDGGANFKGSVFSEAQDAVVFFGSSDPAKAQVITSTSNTLDGVIPGATVNLNSTSDQPVQVTVSEDNEAAISAAKAFVTGFNNLMTTIDTYDAYNAETEERGLLLGESALSQLKNRLYSTVVRRSADLSGSFSSLSQVGITVGTGAVLQFNETKFRDALATDREAVESLFTFKTTETNDDGETVTAEKGVGVALDELLERLTDTEFGLIESRVSAIDRQLELNNDRIEQLDLAIAAKRLRLETQFAAMESALADLQSQSSALASFQPVSFSGISSAQAQ